MLSGVLRLWGNETTMRPKTLLEMAGAQATPPKLADCAIVVIDAQREYVDGALPLSGVKEALAEIAKLLDRARHLGVPVIHVKHRGKAGGAFDPDATRGQIAEEVSPPTAKPSSRRRCPIHSPAPISNNASTRSAARNSSSRAS